MRLSLSIIIVLAAIACFAIPQTPALAQEGDGSGGNIHDIRNAVKAGSLSARSPGLRIKTAISGGHEITEAPSDEPSLRKTMVIASIDALLDLFDRLILSLQAAIALQQAGSVVPAT